MIAFLYRMKCNKGVVLTKGPLPLKWKGTRNKICVVVVQD